jgi:hypothetical protein
MHNQGFSYDIDWDPDAEEWRASAPFAPTYDLTFMQLRYNTQNNRLIEYRDYVPDPNQPSWDPNESATGTQLVCVAGRGRGRPDVAG